MSIIILFNKPFNVLSQFTDKNSPTERQTLSTYINIPRVYPAGRLDRDSEGLLILTDNGKLQQQIANPKYAKQKSYWVQVEGEIDNTALQQLKQGIQLKDGLTKPAKAKIISEPAIWPRIPPIRERKNIPTSWIELNISEGKNRQVRRMTAAIGFPTLRLIRNRVANWKLKKLQPGEFIKLYEN